MLCIRHAPLQIEGDEKYYLGTPEVDMISLQYQSTI